MIFQLVDIDKYIAKSIKRFFLMSLDLQQLKIILSLLSNHF